MIVIINVIEIDQKEVCAIIFPKALPILMLYFTHSLMHLTVIY
jgi:hypothetical protein